MTTNIVHPFASAKADGADATLVRPTNWNAVHTVALSMTNRSGAAVAINDACAVGTANDDSFTTTTTQSDLRPLVVALAAIADAAAGNVQHLFEATVNVQGNVTRGNYLRFSTTAGRLEDAGIAGTAAPVAGCNAIAVTGYAGGGAGTVTAILGVQAIPSGVTFAGSDTTERSTQSTTSVTLSTITVKSIPVTSGIEILVPWRKVSGGGNNSVSLGITLNATVITAPGLISDTVNENRTGFVRIYIPPYDTVYFGGQGLSHGTGNAAVITGGMIDPVARPNAAVTTVIITGLVSNAAATLSIRNVIVNAVAGV